MERIERFHVVRERPSALYCDAVRFGDLLSISGMLPVDSQGRIVGKGDPAEQAEQAFRNIGAVLSRVGASFSDVVKITIYLTDIQQREAISSVRKKFFGDQVPSSTLLEISRLADPEALLEIEAMVYLGGK